jgi:phage major head subunit gpT-like protein
MAALILKALVSMLYPDLLITTDITGGDVHQEGNFGKLLFPKFRKIFYETYDEVPSQFDKVFKTHKSNAAQEFDYGLGAFTPWTKFGTAMTAVPPAVQMPTVHYQTIPAGLERVYTHDEFAEGFMVERKFADDEKYRVIEKMPADLARAGRYKVETDAAGLLNNGFLALGYDNKPLFAADHPLLGGGVCSNLIPAPLSDTALKSATLLARKTVDEAGKLIQIKPDTLIVSPANEFLAMELIKTAQKPGTDLNDINSLMGKFKILVWDFLTDDDAWFLLDSKRHELNFFWRVKPEFKHVEDFDTLVAKYRGYMRYSFGYSDWRGIVGSPGIA